jgi:paraquat-inducible protein B
MIGAFAVGAVVLGVAGTFLLGSGRLFADTESYVMYFQGSLKGLSVGSPVTLGGIQIGSVTEIDVIFDVDAVDYEVPVTIEIDRDTFVSVQAGREVARDVRRDPHEGAKLLIERGFRAQLQTRSYVTGMLEVALDFHPGTEVSLVGGESEYPEIPTIPSSAEQLSRNLASLPVKELVSSLKDVAEGVDELVNSERLDKAIAALQATLQNLRRISEDVSANTTGIAEGVRTAVDEIKTMVENINRQVEPLSASAQATLEQGRGFFQNTDKQVGLLASQLNEAITAAEGALGAAQGAMGGVEDTASGLPALSEELTVTLKELSSAARALRELVDYLERHPEALLRGKGGR